MGNETTVSDSSGIQESEKPAIGTSESDVISDVSIKQPSLDVALKELERVKADLKKVHAESLGHRKKAEELDKLKAEIEASKLTETEKLQKQLTELQSAREADVERLIAGEIRQQAAEMGVRTEYLKRVATMLDWAELEYDESTGMPTNTEAVLKDLLKEMPFLTGKQAASAGGATNPGRQAANNTGLSWDVITKMTPEHYTARQAEIQAWMRRNPPKGF